MLSIAVTCLFQSWIYPPAGWFVREEMKGKVYGKVEDSTDEVWLTPLNTFCGFLGSRKKKLDVHHS